MHDSDTIIASICVILLLAVTLLAMTPAIHAWGRANDYPYGKLCELYRSCR